MGILDRLVLQVGVSGVSPVTIWDSLPSHVLGCEKRKPRWETCHPHIFMWKLKQSQSYQPSQKGSGFTQSSWGSSWFRSLMVSYLFGWMLFHLLLCIAFTKEMFLTQSFKLSGLVILVPRYDDPGRVWRKKSLGVEYCIAKTHHLVVFCMDISSWALKAIPASQVCHGITLKILFRLVLGSPFWRWSSFARYTSVALALWSNERIFFVKLEKISEDPSITSPYFLHIFQMLLFWGNKKWKKQTALSDGAMWSTHSIITT